MERDRNGGGWDFVLVHTHTTLSWNLLIFSNNADTNPLLLFCLFFYLLCSEDDGHGNLNHVLVASSKIEQNEYDHLKTGYPTPSYNTFTDHPNQGQPGAPNGAGNGVVAVADRKDNDRYLVTRMVCAMFSGFSFMLRSVFCGCCASSNSRSCH